MYKLKILLLDTCNHTNKMFMDTYEHLYYSYMTNAYFLKGNDMKKIFTVTLVMIRMQKDFNDPVNEIPDEMLEMGKEKAVNIRQFINAELIRRGITNI